MSEIEEAIQTNSPAYGRMSWPLRHASAAKRPNPAPSVVERPTTVCRKSRHWNAMLPQCGRGAGPSTALRCTLEQTSGSHSRIARTHGHRGPQPSVHVQPRHWNGQLCEQLHARVHGTVKKCRASCSHVRGSTVPLSRASPTHTLHIRWHSYVDGYNSESRWLWCVLCVACESNTNCSAGSVVHTRNEQLERVEIAPDLCVCKPWWHTWCIRQFFRHVRFFSITLIVIFIVVLVVMIHEQ